MTEQTRPAGLVRKLAEIMAAVERVPKRGRNEFHRYDYATEADIAAVVRKEMAERHVMLIPAVLNHERHELSPNKKGEARDPLTVLHMSFSFYDGDTGESIVMPWIGVGQDGGDKGAYKAMTGGMKYVLMKVFLMPTGDDPETEGKREARKAERAADSEAKAQQRAESKAATVISADERRTLGDMAKASGWPIAEVKRLLTAHGFASSSDVTKDKYPLIVDALKHGGEVPHTPQVGVKAPENALAV